MSKLAVIDIGTNSIHMVLAEILPDAGFKILDRFKDMTRLGNGVFSTRRLSEEAMARALEVLKTLVTLARNKGFERIIAVATSAVREAQNGGDFVAFIMEQTGLRVRHNVAYVLERTKAYDLDTLKRLQLSLKKFLNIDQKHL